MRKKLNLTITLTISYQVQLQQPKRNIKTVKVELNTFGS